MAGQKREAQTSILRRVMDLTPLRPARLEKFQTQGFNAAQFAARYFSRENQVIQRLLNIGGVFSPIHRTIGRSVVSRYTEFNNSFGPVQRAIRHQPEHTPRRMHQPGTEEGGFEEYGGFEAEDFGYTPEPANFNRPEPLAPQFYQPDYNGPAQETLPWETPLNTAPLPVARRIEFQPANLQYLRNPESLAPTRPLTEHPVERVAERRVPPGNPALSVQRQPQGAANSGQNTIPAIQPNPLATSNDFVPGAVERVTEFNDPGYAVEAAYLRLVTAQPALSRALQRTFEATAPQPSGLATPTFNQGAAQGASPAAVARHFAVPATLARYRAVKQAADKVIYGEEPAFSPEPVLSPSNYAPAPAQPVLPSVVQPALTAETTEARRTQEAWQPLSDLPSNGPIPANRPGAQPSGVTSENPAPGEHLPLQRTPEPLSGQQPPTSSGQIAALPGANQAQILAGQAGTTEIQRLGQPGSTQPTLSQGTTPLGRTSRPNSSPVGAFPEFNQSLAGPALFDQAIPASLLGMTSSAYEAQRLTGERETLSVAPRPWATNLPTLRNNPGVATRQPLARQLSEPVENNPQAGLETWSGSGAGTYYDRRRPRRVDAALSAEGEAAETQDRIFSLAEPSTGASNFQPQFMQALAAEAVAPTQPPINRTLPAAPRVQANPSPAPGNLAERTVSRELPGLDLAREAANLPTNRVHTPPSRNLETGGQANQASRVEGEVSPGGLENYANEQDVSVESRTGFSASPSGPTEPLQFTTGPQIPTDSVPGASDTNQPLGDTAAAVPTYAGRERAESGQTLQGVESGVEPGQTIRSSGPQPTALQRAFKRLDLDEVGAAPALWHAFNPDFGTASFNYTARPGAYRRHSNLSGESADYTETISFEPGQKSYPEPPYSPANYAQPPLRETLTERPFEKVARSEDVTGTTNKVESSAQNATPVKSQEDAATSETAPGIPLNSGLAQVAGETGFETLPGRVVQRNKDTTGAYQPGPLEGPRVNQPQYFANSLEFAWLTPENRLVAERLPGGSGALQRLREAPGQLTAFLEQFRATSLSGLNLSSLHSNPGLAENLARTLEGTNPGLDSPTERDWTGAPPLNFTLRRRSIRPAHEGFSGFESTLEQGGDTGFEAAQPLPLPNPNTASNTNFGQPQVEIARVYNPQTDGSFPTQGSAGRVSSFQERANRETLGRIQRSGQTGPAQPAANSPFTITNDWVAQLQRRFAGFSVGQLSDATGQVMRFFNNEVGSLPGSNAGFSSGANFGTAPGFNYAVPPLLWRKVSDYAPHNDLPFDQVQTAGAQPGFTYTSPGEVLRAYEQGQFYPGMPDEDTARPADAGEAANQARLELPRLEQTHQLLQRIASLENTNLSLELAHRMEAAAHSNDAVPSGRPTAPVSPSQPGPAQFSPLRPAGVQRLPDMVEGKSHRLNSDFDAAEAVEDKFIPPLLRMTDVPVNRQTSENRFVESDAGIFTGEDDGFARPAPSPEIRVVAVRVPERPNFATPLEAAAARSGPNGPNIGQGEILQPLAIQRKASATGSAQTAIYAPLAQPTLHNVIKTSVGKALNHQVQRKMTGIFGAQFQDVRVHTGDEAAHATRQVGAEAFTLGSNIYFAPGRYQPESLAGQALIGHELTHVIQQSSLPSLGGGRVPETSSLGQTLEHHAIANEQLLLRHLSSNHDDHNHQHSFSSNESGRLSYQDNRFSSSYSGSSATVERSYQPVSEQNSHPPIKPAHIRNESGSSQPVQRVIGLDPPAKFIENSNEIDVNDLIKNQENMDRLARRVYQIIRDQLLIERERGFGPGNGKFF